MEILSSSVWRGDMSYCRTSGLTWFMTRVRYSVEGGAWNFSMHNKDETSFGSRRCIADTEVAIPNINTRGNCSRYVLEWRQIMETKIIKRRRKEKFPSDLINIFSYKRIMNRIHYLWVNALLLFIVSVLGKHFSQFLESQ